LDSTLKSSFVSREDTHLQAIVIYQTGQQRKELSGSLGSILALLALNSTVDFNVVGRNDTWIDHEWHLKILNKCQTGKDSAL
jgi:hypothetical protein